MSRAGFRFSLPVLGQAAVMAALGVIAVVLFRLQGASTLHFDVSQERIVAVAAVLAIYVAFCLAIATRVSRRHAAVEHSATSDNEILIVYASQTGTAEALALRTLDTLRHGSIAARCLSIANVDSAMLAGCDRALFVVSTTGEGDAPDDAYAFVRDAMQNDATIPKLRYGLLSLGDREYQTFCGFGRMLEHWLREHGATPLFDSVEVDDGDEGALRHWQHQLTTLGANVEAADWSRPDYQRWTLAQRRVLNPGSPGAPAVWIRMEPIGNEVSPWQAGDVVEILPGPPGSDHPHREYSIASLPQDGGIELLVRQMRGADGQLGLGSGWLTERAVPGDEIALRTRRNASFHAPSDARPMILIGNGTGIAGLRALLKERIAAGRHRNWLLFGERTRAHDLHFGDELQQWHADAKLERMNCAYSRDEPRGRYVQHLVTETAETLRAWIADGASIYVCGSLRGMAPAVDTALADALGAAQMEQLRIEGRYRRDVY